MTNNPNETSITRRKAENVATFAKVSRELTPRVDVYESADELLMLADMPGAVAESVYVRLDGGQLTLEAERALAEDAAIRYFRAFRMPAIVDPNGISAELKNGVLNVHLKKAESAKPRTIAIHSA